MIDWVRNTSILGYASVSKINFAVFIKCYVLKKSVTLNCVVDVRLRILIKVNNLSIASALKVKYAVVIPAVLVVTDKQTLRIC